MRRRHIDSVMPEKGDMVTRRRRDTVNRSHRDAQKDPPSPRLRVSASPRLPVSASPSLRVLLVDDHRLFLEGLSNLLTSQGIEIVGQAHDGLEALAAARRTQPDVILMDIHMPRCDGVAATRLIKAEMPACKIVMLTMSENEQDLFEAVKSGASGYLLKRVDAEEFFTYLSDLQAGHPPFSPGLAEKILQEFTHPSLRTETRLPPSVTQAESSQTEDVPEASISARQMQILTLVAQGQTYRQVAATIGITERTVKYHMAEILDRLHLDNRAQVIAYAARMGLTERQDDTVTR
jgi:DNA-binding NarL/FixJ family response regulator